MIIIMGIGIVIGIVVALLLILGGLLFLVAQFFVQKMKSREISESKTKLWVWRSFIMVLVIYSYVLFLTNKNLLFSMFQGPFEALKIFLVIFLVIYFIGLVEMIVIDLLLPDVIAMWKRILIEVLVFILLCGLTLMALHIGSGLITPLV
jgi:hypothetical protein